MTRLKLLVVTHTHTHTREPPGSLKHRATASPSSGLGIPRFFIASLLSSKEEAERQAAKELARAEADSRVVGKQRRECSRTLSLILHSHLATFQPGFIRAAGVGNGVAVHATDRRARGNSRASCHGVGEKTRRSAA
jgi:hypothetical protein